MNNVKKIKVTTKSITSNTSNTFPLKYFMIMKQIVLMLKNLLLVVQRNGKIN